MATELLHIDSIEKKNTKANKPYAVVSTDKGNYSCFDTAVIESLTKCIHQSATCDILENGQYLNIIACNPIVQTPKGAEDAGNISYEFGYNNKIASMVVSYVKDLACAEVIEMKDFGGYCHTLMKLLAQLSK